MGNEIKEGSLLIMFHFLGWVMNSQMLCYFLYIMIFKASVYKGSVNVMYRES